MGGIWEATGRHLGTSGDIWHPRVSRTGLLENHCARHLVNLGALRETVPKPFRRIAPNAIIGKILMDVLHALHQSRVCSVNCKGRLENRANGRNVRTAP